MDSLPLVVANFKANKTWDEVLDWLEEVGPQANDFPGTIIVCPSMAYVSEASRKIKSASWRIKVAAQDISKFDQGAYTGEVTAAQIADQVNFAIIGHSERRKYSGETDSDVMQKAKSLLKHKISPILCISDIEQLDSYLKEEQEILESLDNIVFVYEPPSAISGGGEYHPQDPQEADTNAAKISDRIGRVVTTIYGGSVNPQNAASFFLQKNIDGGLVGQASLDPQEFLKIVEAIS